MDMMERDGQPKIFVNVNQLSKETGLPRNQITKDIHSGILPAFKRGKSYYIYTTDASKYIFNLVCKARGIDPDKYSFLVGIDMVQILEAIEKGLDNNDKFKN